MRGLTALALGCALVLSAGITAEAGERTKTRAEATSPGADSAQRVNPERKPTTKPVKLYGTKWYRGADATVAAATKAKKPVVLLNILGDLDGKT